jgi:hypothetical protein
MEIIKLKTNGVVEQIKYGVYCANDAVGKVIFKTSEYYI